MMAMLPRWTALLLSLTLCACSIAPPRTEQFQALEPDTRATAFESVWEGIRERYYDPTYNGVDWNAVHQHYRERVRKAQDDASFWHTLQRLAAELREASGVYAAYGFQHLDPQRDVRITLLEGAARILAPLTEQVATVAHKLLEERGIRVVTACKVTAIEAGRA